MKVFKNQYATFELFSEEKLLILTWTPETEYMNNEEWKEVSLEIVSFFQKHTTTRLLADTRRNEFIITPELQNWAAENIFPPSVAAGLKKVAYIVSSNLFSAVSMEQVMEEETAKPFEVSYFTKEEEARAWLF